jgi:chemotaxis-related protein WspD
VSAAVQPALDHCWRRIGVQGGDHSCERLDQVLHCRNCPVFSAAARTLLQRESPAEAVPEWRDIDRRRQDRASALVFRLGAQWLGLPPDQVVEVAPNPGVRRLAHRTGGRIEGLVNVRGELRLCVSLVELLGLGTRGAGDGRARLVLVHDQGQVLAFRCDEMQGLAAYGTGQVQAPPDTLPAALRGCVAGMLPLDGRHVALLDGEGLTRLLRQAVFE